MNTQILKDIGLTQSEITTYVTLLKIGPSAAGPIMNESNSANSTLHRDLKSLIKQGLISFIKEGKRNIYQATDPERLFDFLEEKKLLIKDLVPELKKIQAPGTEMATVYKGIKGIKQAYNIMINTTGEEYNTFGGGTACVKLMGVHWWMNIHKRRIAFELPSRQVFDLSVREEVGLAIEEQELTRIQYVPADFSGFQETVIVGDTVAVCVFTDSPYAFVIQDNQVAQGYKRYFEVLWSKAT